MGNRELFDAVASVYDESPPFFQRQAVELVARAELPAGVHVADLGAGAGAVSAAVHALPGDRRLTAVDIAPAMLARMRDLDLRGVDSVHADLSAMPFADATFDHAVSGFTLHILAHPDVAAGEIFRVLRPGGTLTWSMPGDHPETLEWAADYGQIYAEFTSRVSGPPAEMIPGPPPEEVMARAGFRLLGHEQVPVSLPVGGPEGYWAWTQTHGARWVTEALPARDARELRARVIDSLRRLHPSGGRTIMVAPHIYRHQRPGSEK